MSSSIAFRRPSGLLRAVLARMSLRVFSFDALSRVLVAHRARLASLLAAWVGAGAAIYLTLGVEPPAWAGAGGIILGLGAVVAARASGRVVAFALALTLLAAGLGFGAAQWASYRAAPVTQMPKKAVLVSGRLVSVDALPDGGRRVSIDRPMLMLSQGRATDPDDDAHGAQMARSVRIGLRAGDSQPLQAGETVRLRAMLRDPPAPDFPGGRDMQREAYFNGLGGLGYALGPVEVLSSPGKAGMATRWHALRERIATRVMAVLPGAPGAVAAVMLTGLGTALPQAERDAFAASGLAHLLAVAGLHIGIVMGVVLAVVRMALALSERAALRWPCREIAAIAALGAGGLYMALTGMHIPIIRSFVMACLVTLALVVGRRALSMRGLALAATVLLLTSPDDVLDVGFQMSFSAVGALIAGYEALRGAMLRVLGAGGWWGRLRHRVVALAMTSLLAGSASAPFALYHFGRLQPWFVLANLLAVPLTAMLVLPAGMVAVLLMPFGADRPALWVMGRGIELILWCAHRVAALPGASLQVGTMPGWGLALVSVGLAVLCVWPTRARLLALLPLGVGLVSPVFVDRPALLVSADAGLIAVSPVGGTAWVERGRTDKVVEADWLQDWAAARLVRLPGSGSVEGGDIVCDPAVCTITRAGYSVLLVRAQRGGRDDAQVALPAGACESIALLVSPGPAEGACPGVKRIDRFNVWRDGPAAVWIGADGVRVVSDRASRGARPWVPPPPFARHVQLTLPLAQAE